MRYILILFIAAGSLLAQHQDEDPREDPFLIMSLPGEEHELLADLEGLWEQTYEYYVVPNAEPIVTKGKAELVMVMEGRFLKWNAQGEANGQKFNSLTIIGYDKAQNQYTLYGIDTFGTQATNAIGTYDDKKDIIIFTGDAYNPDLNDNVTVRFELNFVDNNTFTLSAYSLYGGTEVKVFEAKNKRRM